MTGSACQVITGTPRVLRQFGDCRITAHTLLASLLGGARQEGIHCITAHPILERVPGGVRPDITAHRVCDINRGTLVCGVTERNMGQSLYLCFDSAGFCVGTRHGPALSSCKKSWGRHCAGNNAGAQRYSFFGSFSDIWQSRHSASPGGSTHVQNDPSGCRH